MANELDFKETDGDYEMSTEYEMGLVLGPKTRFRSAPTRLVTIEKANKRIREAYQKGREEALKEFANKIQRPDPLQGPLDQKPWQRPIPTFKPVPGDEP